MPTVVAVHDYPDEPTGAFLVMDYVEGEPLSQLIARVGRLPAARTVLLTDLGIARTEAGAQLTATGAVVGDD